MKGLVLALLIPWAAMAQLPGFATTAIEALVPTPDAVQWTPMTQHDRFRFYLKTTFSASTLAGAVVASGFKQALGRPFEWDTHIHGYGQRVGDDLAKAGVRSTLRYGVAAVLREDNRYIPSGKTSIRARLWYAVSTTYTARDTEGHRRFGYSKFIGNAGTSALSRYWEPPSRQGGKNIAVDFLVISSIQTGFNVAREFSSDVLQRLKR